MGMTITNCWKLFCYGVKRDHYEKLIGIREFLERLAQDCFNNNFSSDSRTLAKNVPPLDEFDDEDTAETLGDPYHKQVPLPSIPAYRAREATT